MRKTLLTMCYCTTADLLLSLALMATQLSRSAFSTQSTRNRHSVSLSHAFLKKHKTLRTQVVLLTKIYDRTPIDDVTLEQHSRELVY
jgi:hypothetical protein